MSDLLLRKPGVGEVTRDMVAPRKLPAPKPGQFAAQIREAYDAGKMDGVESVIARYTLPDGLINIAALKKEQRRLGRTVIEPMNRTITELEAMAKALDRFVQISKGTTSRAHKRATSVLTLREKLKARFFVPLKSEDIVPPPIDEMRYVPWFDFRQLPIKSDSDMVAFGKELIESGMIELPFPKCVFLLPFADPENREISLVCLLEQGERRVMNRALLFVGVGNPVGLHMIETISPFDATYYALAVLTSKVTRRTRRSVQTDAEVDTLFRGDSYFAVNLHLPTSYGEDGQGRHHASPRLHWRRGHIRHLGNRTTWVRATLVGVSDNGVVIHDYAATPSSTGG